MIMYTPVDGFATRSHTLAVTPITSGYAVAVSAPGVPMATKRRKHLRRGRMLLGSTYRNHERAH